MSALGGLRKAGVSSGSHKRESPPASVGLRGAWPTGDQVPMDTTNGSDSFCERCRRAPRDGFDEFFWELVADESGCDVLVCPGCLTTEEQIELVRMYDGSDQ
jgi:hypothetical protein